MRSTRVMMLLAVFSIAAIFCGSVSPTSLFEPSPTVPVTATAVPTPSPPTGLPASETGGISGHLSYPSEFIPELRVVAFDVIHPGIYYYVDTVQNQNTYKIEDIPPGTYHVVAYALDPAMSVAGGYSQYIPCGEHYGCDDHTLLDVVVVSGEVTENINPDDWYAPAGAFLPRPGP